MKFSIAKPIIENILVSLQPFLEKKDTSQITSHVYIEAEQDIVIFKSTDFEIGLKIETDQVTVSSHGKVTANGKKLLDIVRILKDDQIVLEEMNSILHLKQQKSKYRLNTYDANEYPTFPTYIDLPKFDINSTLLVQSLKKITPPIDTNNPKYELNGALIDIKENSINFVSTDTRRLAIVTIENKSNNEFSIILPKKAILEIQKLFFNEIEIFYDETYLMIQSQNHFFFTKLINGKFPDYNRIIPKETKHTIALPKAQIIDAIKQITIISNEIKVSFLDDHIKFESLSDDSFEAQTEILFKKEFEETIIFAVNSRYLLDFLSQVQTSEFKILINQSNLPFIVQSENFKTIIMPISL